MLNEKIIELLNSQINKEFESAYLYLSISNFYASKNLKGFSNYFNKQAQEEMEHAYKIMNYLHDEDVFVELKDIKVTKANFTDLKEPLVLQVKHEEYITSLIVALYDLALTLKDYRTKNFLDWYISEQQEEEVRSKELLESFNFASNCNALYQLDISLK